MVTLDDFTYCFFSFKIIINFTTLPLLSFIVSQVIIFYTLTQSEIFLFLLLKIKARQVVSLLHVSRSSNLFIYASKVSEFNKLSSHSCGGGSSQPNNTSCGSNVAKWNVLPFYFSRSLLLYTKRVRPGDFVKDEVCLHHKRPGWNLPKYLSSTNEGDWFR